MVLCPRIVRVPVSFISELDSVKNFHGLELTENFKNRLKLFYGFLIERQASLKSFDYVHLSSVFLRKRIHQKQYRVGIDYLLSRNLIEENESYKKEDREKKIEGYSKSFRVSLKNLDLKSGTVDLLEFKNVKDSFLDCPSLVDVSFSTEDIATLRGDGFKLKDGKKKGWKKFCWDHSLDGVVRGDWWMSRDEKTGRIFTNITSMPKEMRKKILLGGERTVEIDIANSQPFLALSIYPSKTKEREKYLKLVIGGRFYETLKEGLDLDRQKRIKTRDRLKERVYQEVFFGMDAPRYPIWNVFKNLFPELGNIFAEFKKPEVKGKRKSNRLSLTLQKAEADIVVKGVLAECISEGVPLLTVHDSVICKESDQELVMEKFKSHLLQAVGVLPKLRTT